MDKTLKINGAMRQIKKLVIEMMMHNVDMMFCANANRTTNRGRYDEH